MVKVLYLASVVGLISRPWHFFEIGIVRGSRLNRIRWLMSLIFGLATSMDHEPAACHSPGRACALFHSHLLVDWRLSLPTMAPEAEIWQEQRFQLLLPSSNCLLLESFRSCAFALLAGTTINLYGHHLPSKRGPQNTRLHVIAH